MISNPLITSSPDVLCGKPVVAGTRLSVEWVLERLASGESIEQLVDEHPRLTREGVLAAIDYALQVMKSEVVYPLDRAA